MSGSLGSPAVPLFPVSFFGSRFKYKVTSPQKGALIMTHIYIYIYLFIYLRIRIIIINMYMYIIIINNNNMIMIIIYISIYWATKEQMHQSLQESLGHFGSMLEEVGLIGKESLLLHTHQQRDTKQICVFAPRCGCGGVWVDIPCSCPDAAVAAARAAGMSGRVLKDGKQEDDAGYNQNPETATCDPGVWQVVQSAAWPAREMLSSGNKWAALCNGDWVEMVPPGEDHARGARSSVQRDWPPIRCAGEFLQGAVPVVAE